MSFLEEMLSQKFYLSVNNSLIALSVKRGNGAFAIAAIIN